MTFVTALQGLVRTLRTNLTSGLWQSTILAVAALEVLSACSFFDFGRNAPAPAATAQPVQLAPALAIGNAPAANAVPFEPNAADDPLLLKPTDLYPDFGIGDRDFRVDQQAAITGDRDAAMRVALMFQRGSNNVPRDERRMLIWMRRASDLRNAEASYQLYLYFVQRGLDREAVRYERRALEQGYTPPPRLDPRRG